MELTESATLDTKFGVQHFPDLTVIAATTEAGQLGRMLIERFGCRVDFDAYSDDDMFRIARGIVDRCWPDGYEPLDDDTCRVLATAAAGVPRNLRSLVFAGRDLALAGDGEVNAADILVLCDTDPDGCTRAHLDLLERLAMAPNGCAGLPTLAAALQMPADMIRQTEQLLVDRRYVMQTPSGRTITPAGRVRLAAGSIRDAA
jgi:Holliday junction resolvasome RuvABC ATP-dependent DNA helicase subunit